MTRRDLALIQLARLTVALYSGVLAVTIVAALFTRSPLAATVAAVVAALSPLIAVGSMSVGRLGGPPQTTTTEG